MKILKKKLVFKNINNMFGMGFKKTETIFKKIGLNKRNNPSFLKKKKEKNLKFLIKKNLTDKKYKKELKDIQLFSQKIKTYKSIRNKLKYPCRGQRTHTNAKTKKRL